MIKNRNKGSKPRIGNISDAQIFKILGIPQTNLRDWKRRDEDNWRYKIYYFLKVFTKEDINHIIETKSIPMAFKKES